MNNHLPPNKLNPEKWKTRNFSRRTDELSLYEKLMVALVPALAGQGSSETVKLADRMAKETIEMMIENGPLPHKQVEGTD